MGLHIFCFDNTTVFLHAYLNPEEPPSFVWPLEELFPDKWILWKPGRAVYGPRNNPGDWQNHFASEMPHNGLW